MENLPLRTLIEYMYIYIYIYIYIYKEAKIVFLVLQFSLTH